jgi:hypothetical protein
LSFTKNIIGSPDSSVGIKKGQLSYWDSIPGRGNRFLSIAFIPAVRHTKPGIKSVPDVLSGR